MRTIFVAVGFFLLYALGFYVYCRVTYQKFFHWCSFMYLHWGFWKWTSTWPDLTTAVSMPAARLPQCVAFAPAENLVKQTKVTQTPKKHLLTTYPPPHTHTQRLHVHGCDTRCTHARARAHTHTHTHTHTMTHTHTHTHARRRRHRADTHWDTQWLKGPGIAW